MYGPEVTAAAPLTRQTAANPDEAVVDAEVMSNAVAPGSGGGRVRTVREERANDEGVDVCKWQPVVWRRQDRLRDHRYVGLATSAYTAKCDCYTTWIRQPFDCLSKVFKVILT